MPSVFLHFKVGLRGPGSTLLQGKWPWALGLGPWGPAAQSSLVGTVTGSLSSPMDCGLELGRAQETVGEAEGSILVQNG